MSVSTAMAPIDTPLLRSTSQKMQAADGPQPTTCIEQQRIAISSYPPQPQPQAQAQAQTSEKSVVAIAAPTTHPIAPMVVASMVLRGPNVTSATATATTVPTAHPIVSALTSPPDT